MTSGALSLGDVIRTSTPLPPTPTWPPLETGMITPRLDPTVASNTPTCTVTPPVTVRLVPSPTLERPDLTATRWTRSPPRDPLLPRVATTTMPGPSRPTVLTPTPDGANPTTPSPPSPTTTRSTPARFRPTTISGLRTTTAGPPRTRRATATLPLLELTLLLASTLLTAMPPLTTDTDTDTT